MSSSAIKKAKGTIRRLPTWVTVLLALLSLHFMVSFVHNRMFESNRIFNEDFDLAFRESMGFFEDIRSRDWKMLKHIAKEVVNHGNPNDPLEMLKSGPAVWYQNNYEPNFSCQFERRMGKDNGNGDGPKWICDPHRIKRMAQERKKKYPKEPGCVIYSVGSHGDFSFEKSMQDLLGVGTCDIHVFDPGNYEHAMPSPLRKGKHTFYHQWALAKQNNDEGWEPDPNASEQGIRDIVKLLGHDKRESIDIFKIDCETCEWDTYQDWLQPDIPMLRQIQIEVHNVHNQTTVDFFDQHEEDGYVRFHKEFNVYMKGKMVEYAFLKLEKDFML